MPADSRRLHVAAIVDGHADWPNAQPLPVATLDGERTWWRRQLQMRDREIALLTGQIDRADRLAAYLHARLKGVERPVVRVAPHLAWGYPTVGAVATEVVADRVWAGTPVSEVAATHDLTRGQALIACWHEARHTPEHGGRWASWLIAAEPALARPEPNYDSIPDPPTRKDTQ